MLTRRGVAAALLGSSLVALGLWWRYPGVLGLGGALVGLPLLAVLSVARRPPMSVERTVWPTEVTRLERCVGTVTIRRTGGLWPPRLSVVERVAGRPVSIDLRGDASYEVPTSRRGVLTIGPLEVRREGLAGLTVRRVTTVDPVRVHVLPRVLPVRGLPTGIRRGYASADERAERGGTDLVVLREYAPGDDLRRLHWATSARRGTLMVREDADPTSAHLTVLLDDRAASYGDSDPDGLEEAAEVAASLAVVAANEGHPVRLMTVSGRLDQTVHAPLGAPPGRPARVLTTLLAEVTAFQPARPDAAVEPPPVPVSARDVVAVLTGGSARLGPLLAEAGRGTVGVALVVDPAAPGPSRSVRAPVTVLCGRSSAELLRLWDTDVVGG